MLQTETIRNKAKMYFPYRNIPVLFLFSVNRTSTSTLSLTHVISIQAFKNGIYFLSEGISVNRRLSTITDLNCKEILVTAHLTSGEKIVTAWKIFLGGERVLRT